MHQETIIKSLCSTFIEPQETRRIEEGLLFVRFERAAFGTLLIPVEPCKRPRVIVVHLGEKLDDRGRIDRNPPGTIRYRRIEQPVEAGAESCRVVIPPDKRNTGPAAVKMPAGIGEVMPFRYAEIEDAGAVLAEGCRQIAVHYPFDDEAALFQSSSDILDAVWDICKYTIKATTFCGIYVDGDRERIPYEGDAYINQLGHYGVDHEYNFARRSYEYMIRNPTWPSEWHMHSVMMAWADYLYTGQLYPLETYYEEICAKTLMDFTGEDGLISTAKERRTPEMERRLAAHFDSGIIRRDIKDLVDWPLGSFTAGGTGERDNHEMCPVNTVVNAFHAHVMQLMAEIASALDRAEDSERFAASSSRVQDAINALLFDEETGLYVDGAGSRHSSLHSNMFMLAFDLVPEERKPAVLSFVKSRGMACSVYGAQHLLEALYLNGEGDYALELMTARHDRSWWNMIQSGSTMTLEAWDIKYKNNLDWNHAWGAAPANIIPRYVLGVRPLEPGFAKVLIQPQPGSLSHAEGRVPTIEGPVHVAFRNVQGEPFVLHVEIPPGMTARIGIPCRRRGARAVVIDGLAVPAELKAGFLFVDGVGSGRHSVEDGMRRLQTADRRLQT